MIALPEFVAGTVEGVRAVLGDVVNDAAHVAAVFGVVVGDDQKFGDGVLIAKEKRRAADGVVVIVLAVDLVVVGASTLAVDGELSAIIVFETAAAHSGHAGREQDEGIVGVAEG